MKALLEYIPENCRNWSFGLIAFLALSLMPALWVAITHANWGTTFLAVTAIVFLLLPFALQAKFDIYVPRVFSFALALFVYATLVSGEMNRFYYDVWWWDLMLHSASAFAFGLIGLIIIRINVSTKTILAKPVILSIFVFSFALMIGVIWEIFEFSGDQLLGLDMQKDGLNDTMTDFIVNTIGALVAAVIGYFYLLLHKETPFDPVLEKTVVGNT